MPFAYYIFSSKSCRFLAVCSSPLESWWREERLQLSVVLPHGGDVTSTFLLRRWVVSWFPPSLPLIHSNYHICRWQLQSSEFLLSISSINLIEACWVYFSNKLCNISKDIKSCNIRFFFFQLMQYCMFHWSLMKFWGPLWNCSLLPTSIHVPFSINLFLPRQYFSSLAYVVIASSKLGKRKVSNDFKKA